MTLGNNDAMKASANEASAYDSAEEIEHISNSENNSEADQTNSVRDSDFSEENATDGIEIINENDVPELIIFT